MTVRCTLCEAWAATAHDTGRVAVAVTDGARHELVSWSADHIRGLGEVSGAMLDTAFEVAAQLCAGFAALEDVEYVAISSGDGDSGHGGHSHLCVDALDAVPSAVHETWAVAAEHLFRHGSCLQCDLGARAARDGTAILRQDNEMIAFVAPADALPYEVHVQPIRHATSLLDLADGERAALADVVAGAVRMLDRRAGGDAQVMLAIRQSAARDPGALTVSHLVVSLAPRALGSASAVIASRFGIPSPRRVAADVAAEELRALGHSS